MYFLVDEWYELTLYINFLVGSLEASPFQEVPSTSQLAKDKVTKGQKTKGTMSPTSERSVKVLKLLPPSNNLANG